MGSKLGGPLRPAVFHFAIEPAIAPVGFGLRSQRAIGPLGEADTMDW